MSTITKPKTVLYCRVSSKEQEDTGYSLDAQEKLLREYADDKFRVAKVFRISESANGKQIRKTFNEMLQYVAKNRVPIILCEKIDRLTRNLKDAATVSDWILEDDKHEVHFVKESFVVNKNTRAHENLVWDMKVAIARFYTNNLSEEVRKGQKEKLAQGWLPTKPPLGYKTIGEKGHKIHITDEEIAPHVRKMFELYATGNYSLSRLESELYGAGLRTRGGSKLATGRIHILLQDPFYYGKMRWKGEIYKANHDPLISKDLFDKVQITLRRQIRNPHFTKHTPIFKAKMYCEHCSGLVTWETQRGHWYGHCNNHGEFRKCPQKTYIRQEIVEEQMIACFEKIAPQNKDVLGWIEKIVKEDNAQQIEEREKEIQRINGLLFNVRKQKDKYFEATVDERVPVEFCQRKIVELTEEEESLEAALIKVSDKSDEFQELRLIIYLLAYKSNEIYEKALVDEKRLLLSQIFTNIIQDGLKIKENFTNAAEYLEGWVPKLNEDYELQQNGSSKRKTGVFQPVSPVWLRG